MKIIKISLFFLITIIFVALSKPILAQLEFPIIQTVCELKSGMLFGFDDGFSLLKKCDGHSRRVLFLGQSSSTRSLKVFDKNNNLLGIFMSINPVVFNLPSNQILYIDPNSGNVGFEPETHYTTLDCTGTIYIDDNIESNRLLKVNGNFLHVDNNVLPVELSTIKSFNSPAYNNICQIYLDDDDNPIVVTRSNLRPLTAVTNPIQNTVALPLQYRYE